MKYIKYSLIAFSILVIVCHLPFIGVSILSEIDRIFSGPIKFDEQDQKVIFYMILSS
ncbi:hypothetical protein D3C73_668340 [compost metagenome]